MSKDKEARPIEIKCNDCGSYFTWDVAEQLLFKEKGYNRPVRCKPCRQSKRARRVETLAAINWEDIREQFSAINFKYTDARNEKLYTPDVIEDAFVDIQACLTKILERDKYIVYGSKGSGKTALASYYELKAMTEAALFSRVDDLEDFDFASLNEGASLRAERQTTGTWKFLLALRLFTLLIEDEGLCQLNSNLNSLKQDLDKRGLLPSPNLSKLATSALESGAAIGFQFFATVQTKIGSDKSFTQKNPSQIAEVLFAAFKDLRIANGRYLLFIDGLDHVLRGAKEDMVAISDLINAVRIVNEVLLKTKLNAKVVILLRHELARAIPNPDLTKRLADNGLFMEWYHNVKEPFESDLLRVIERRAHLVGFKGKIRDLWQLWLPSALYEARSEKYILSRTRFLPRDVNRFFYFLQQIGRPKFTHDDILAAEQKYSEWYFDELYDSLAGLLDDRVRNSLSSILTELGTYFKVPKLHASLEQRGLSSIISGEELAQILFETHWIGNLRVSAEHKQFHIFKSRSRSAGFSSNLGCVLSWGLIKGLSLNKREDQQKS